MRILITGSRSWVNPFVIGAAIEETMSELYNKAGRANAVTTDPVLIFGDAKGADRWAKLWCKAFGHEYEEYNAEWDRYGKGAGPKRNKVMVDKGADIVLAFPIGASPGTRDCMEKAAAAGIPVVVYEGEEHDTDVS